MLDDVYSTRAAKLLGVAESHISRAPRFLRSLVGAIAGTGFALLALVEQQRAARVDVKVGA